jgi:phage tail sheath protein FI
MPISPTYPGVYIDELPSAVRTIIGVPTSIAAFVGTAPRGSVTDPVHITSWADYEREFGGLDASSDMSYAVYQYFQNGGAEAEIVRVVATKPPAPAAAPAGGGGGAPAGGGGGGGAPAGGGGGGGAPAGGGGGAPAPAADAPTYPAAATATLAPASGNDADAVALTAVSPGDWGNHIRARVDYETLDKATDPTKQKSFNLTLRDTTTGVTESYLSISIDPASSRRLSVALAGSALVTVDPAKADGKLPKANKELKAGVDPFPDGKGAGSGDWYVDAANGKDGTATLTADDYLGGNSPVKDGKQGIYQLLKTDIFNMLCLPGPAGQVGDDTHPAGVLAQAAKLCLDRRAMLIVDPPDSWKTLADAEAATAPGKAPLLSVDVARNAALYFPHVQLADIKLQNRVRDFPPCGVIAGVWARTDVARGVWKAPAGTEAGLSAVLAPSVPMTDLENGILNPLAVNCLRQRPVVGNVVWGARTLMGADFQPDGEWRYVPVRRLALFIEESLFRGTQWVVFEPNDEPLWSSIRLNVGAFMNTLFRQGAFQGRTPAQAYQVVCDATNNPQNDIDRGIVNIQVGFAPLKPAEFVIIHIQQLAGQIQV